jgi:hypothetical protein
MSALGSGHSETSAVSPLYPSKRTRTDAAAHVRLVPQSRCPSSFDYSAALGPAALARGVIFRRTMSM